ncbi:uncharacterized protein [Halyomorpha halys]|uniref:uncharacterized protein n=1 Tax=Halyomorpha halys TaxID=286706 RepID=UPI0034D2B6C1
MDILYLNEAEGGSDKPSTPRYAPGSTFPTVHEDIALGQGEHEGIGARDSLHGYLFHLRLCTLFVLRSLELRKRGIKFSVAAEHKPLNPFDDIVCWVMTNEEKVYHLIQVKHGKPPVTKKITAKDLTKTKFNNWGDKFTLHHYLKGYCKVKKMQVFESTRTNFIVTTNIDMDLNDVKNGGISIKLFENHDFVQIMKESDKKCYRLELKDNSEIYKALKKSSGANDEEMKMFLEDFIMAVNLPDAALLENMINEDIGVVCDFPITRTLGSELQKNMFEWINQQKGIWLTETSIEKLLTDVEESIVYTTVAGADYSEIIKDINIVLGEGYIQFFKSKIAKFISPQSKEHLLQINTSPELSFLTAIKLRQVLQSWAKHRFQFLWIRFGKQKEYFKLFKFRFTVKILVIYCKVKDNILQNKAYLCEICKICVDKSKKIILISEEKIEIEDFKKEIPLLKAVDDEDVGFSFKQLNLKTQTRLLNKEVIIFQGNENKISLTTLCRLNTENKSETTDLLKEIIDSSTLISLIKSDTIWVGNEVKDSPIIDYPIEWNNKLFPSVVLSGEGNGESRSEKRAILVKSEFDYSPYRKPYLWLYKKVLVNAVTEDKLVRGENRIVMFTDWAFRDDKAQIGKTALTMVFNNVIRKLKISDKNLWICRINTNNFTKEFKMGLENRKRTFISNDIFIDILVEHLMEAQEDTRLRTEFEKKLFRMAIDGRIRLFLFFEVFDENCLEYEDLIKKIMRSLNGSKIEKVFVTTRPVGEPLEDINLDQERILKNTFQINRWTAIKYIVGEWFDNL